MLKYHGTELACTLYKGRSKVGTDIVISREDSLEIFKKIRHDTMTNTNYHYRVPLQQQGIKDPEVVKALARMWRAEGWILQTSQNGGWGVGGNWILTDHSKAYEPDAPPMTPEQREQYLEAARYAMRNGRIVMSRFEELAPREGLWRLLLADDIERHKTDCGARYFTLPKAA